MPALPPRAGSTALRPPLAALPLLLSLLLTGCGGSGPEAGAAASAPARPDIAESPSVEEHEAEEFPEGPVGPGELEVLEEGPGRDFEPRSTRASRPPLRLVRPDGTWTDPIPALNPTMQPSGGSGTSGGGASAPTVAPSPSAAPTPSAPPPGSSGGEVPDVNSMTDAEYDAFIKEQGAQQTGDPDYGQHYDAHNPPRDP